MHCAEAALTKLSVWQVKDLAATEGPRSPFASLPQKLTRYLVAISLTTTACSIYATALFVASVSALVPAWSLGLVSALLTFLTLFFGELLPKAVAVRYSEAVARRLLPFIARLAAALAPLTMSFTALSDAALRLGGLSPALRDDEAVSEHMLRRVVDEAQRSSEGIESGEGRMIKGVLDMQHKEIARVMRPRVDIVAVPVTLPAADILRAAVSSRYSRMPVFEGDVDHVVGVVFAKDLLDFVAAEGAPGAVAPDWAARTARDLMEPAYFVPETMSCWAALQEMRKRRTHMAIVVDEYGGTGGLVTFEDLLEEVVGEIYDEDDGCEERSADRSILRRGDGWLQIKASAELDDVCEALDIAAALADPELPECSTLGGLLCALAGRIPRAGEHVDFAGYRFTIRSVEGSRRLVDVLVCRAPAADGAAVEPPAASAALRDGDGDGDDGAASSDAFPPPLSGDGRSEAASADGAASATRADQSARPLIFRDGEWLDSAAA